MHLFFSRACDGGLPLPAYPDRAATGLERWRAVFGNSPYLTQICAGEPTLAKLGGASDFEDLREKMRATAESVHGHFRYLIEIPAGPNS